MATAHDHHFVEDGYECARDASIDAICLAVEREYAERLERADGWFERWQLRRQMRREIKRRLDCVAPPWGLYFSPDSEV